MRTQTAFCSALLLLVSVGVGRSSAEDQGPPPVRNGFTLSDSLVPIPEIRPGGPARDGIPALSDPAVYSVRAAPWNDDETVIGLALGAEARAYPVALLNWHELVNDTLGGQAVLITFCPLCGTGIVFDRRLDGTILHFGVSGLLYQSDMLLYDRESESLWSQIKSQAVTGPASGMRLTILRSELTSWGNWRSQHPSTTVLSLDTGHRRDYTRSPYAGYAESPELYFPAPLDRRYHPKAPTLGIRLRDGRARAYPGSEVTKAGGRVAETFAGAKIVISFDEATRTFDAIVPREFEVIEGFWFAWSAFHPKSSVFAPSSPASPTN